MTAGASTGSCVIHDAAQLVVGPATATDPPLTIVEGAALAVENGVVAAVGPTDEVTREFPVENAAQSIDARGKAVVPGFVDPHTHAVFAGDRSDEFEARTRGKTYQEIHAEGGGIRRTVRATRASTLEDLVSSLLDRLDAMLASGTTTVEAKSGYGLDVSGELLLLRAIERANEVHPVDVVATFMGAHAVPEGATADEYVDRVIDEQLPAVESQGVAEFCDVFCEEDVFLVEQSRRVLSSGVAHGLTPKVHAEEFTRLGGAQLAADVWATSADHLLHATDEDVDALVESGVVPVFLPATAFGLGEAYADPRPFLERGTPVAIATDCNPSCLVHRQGFAMTLACVEMGMTPAEVLRAATVDAAAAIDRHDGTGTLEVGAPADAVVLDAPSYVHVPYRYDATPVACVVKGGRVVYDGRAVIRDDEPGDGRDDEPADGQRDQSADEQNDSVEEEAP